MSFAERQLRFTFSGAQSGSFSAQGLRAVASIQAAQGRLGVQAQVKIWGLSLAQMDAYSSAIPAAIGGTGVSPFNLMIEAGDMGDPLSQVVNAAIWASFIDLTDSPESAFNVSVAGIYLAADMVAPQSQPGAQDAEQLIASLCATSGLTLNNPSGAHAVLRNQATYGSVIDQIETIARAAKLLWKIDGTNIWLWPPGGSVDDVTIPVGPDAGMVGYPQYYETGIIVTSLFNQQVQVGRLMNVSSSIPKANGTWQIIQAQHDLTTMLDKGPWFTTAILAAPGSA